MGLFDFFRKRKIDGTPGNLQEQNAVSENAAAFSFNGDWITTFKFKAFEGMQSRHGAYTSKDTDKLSDGTVNMEISDELNDETDPSEEQINAVNYIIENPKLVINALLTSLEKEYANFKEIYGYDEEEDQDLFPVITNLEDYKKVFGVSNVFILLPSKDNFAYVGLECGCTWDDEHGLGFLMHKDRVIKIGGADEAFDSWEAYKDNGTLEQEQIKWKEINQDRINLPKPKIYKPNPKYNKLNPSQLSANKMYENNLIERGYNEEFKELVESGKIDINKNEGLSMTFLERATQFNNEEISLYIISKKPHTLQYAIHNAARHCNKTIIEALLKNGIAINEQDYWKNTAYSITQQTIEWMTKENDKRLDSYNNFLEWLIAKGAKI